MLYEYTLSNPREDFINITSQIREAVAKSGVTDGIAVVFCPHTTAGITINENADPDVVHDMLIGLNKAFPDWCGVPVAHVSHSSGTVRGIRRRI